ncbi:hypothetical protein ABPG75_004325 [Micractinium tetrahymenae]
MLILRQRRKAVGMRRGAVCSSALLLAAALLPAALAVSPAAEAEADAAIMRQLRASVHAWNPQTMPGAGASVALEGPLPPAWHRGFRSLRSLSLRIRHRDVPPLPGGLPSEWAAGFPRLQLLGFGDVRVSEPTLPQSWAEGGFPLLQTLQLYRFGLQGTLPPQLLPAHPELRMLGLAENRLRGTLPPEWGAHEGIEVVDLRANLLTGPAFPPAWLRDGALPQLKRLELSSNDGLNGSLPASLPWPGLQGIDVSFTKVAGSIPAAWCRAAFNATLHTVVVTSTGISDDLPPCAKQSLPLFSLQGMPHSASGSSSPAGLGWAAAAAGLLAAAVAGAAVAVAVLRRKQRRRQAKLHELLGGEEQGLLLPCQQQPPACGAGNRRRLAALLSRQLASEGGGGIEVLPLDALPLAFTHHVGALAGSAADSGATPPSAFAQHAAQAGSFSAGSAGGMDSSSPGSSWAASRQWGLETQGLKLRPEALEFVTGPDGCLVELGAGSHAVVYLGRLCSRQVAVKVFELQPGAQSHTVWQEAALMRRCSHPHVLPLLGIALKGHVLLMVTQLMRGGSLRAALEHPERRAELRWNAHGRRVALDIAEALAYLHGSLQVRHTDLKASNVLLSEGWRACVSDLGMAQMVGQGPRSAAGFTATHAAPEQLLAQRCSLAADVYSLGLVLAELTTGQVVKRRGEWRLPRAPEECPPAVAELIRRCTLPEPAARPTAAEVLHALLET